ncbi:MAG: hypothetical protein VB140_10490 [Burkholderia sp.]
MRVNVNGSRSIYATTPLRAANGIGAGMAERDVPGGFCAGP